MFSYVKSNFIKKFFKIYQILLHDHFGKMEINVLAAFLKRKMFLNLFLLIYGCLRCIQVWHKFGAKILMVKYFLKVGST